MALVLSGTSRVNSEMNKRIETDRQGEAASGKTEQSEKYGAAFIIIAIYFFFEYVRPQDAFIGALAILKIPMFMSIALFIYLMKSDKSALNEKLVFLVLLFLLEISVSVVFARNSHYVFMAFKGMTLMIIVSLAMPLAIQTMSKYIAFVKYWILINVALAYHVITHGGRGPGGFTWDENDVALTLVMVIPLTIAMIYFKGAEKNKKIIYMIATAILTFAVMASMSRGGFLGLASIPFAYWLWSKDKMKNLAKLALIAVLFSYPVYQLTPEEYKEEILSITDTEDDTRNTRLEFWGLAWDMYLDNPVIGVGARNYPWNVATYQLMRKDRDPDGKLLGGREVHSLYFSLLAELGTVGTVLYIMIVLQLIKKLLFIVRLGESKPEYYNMGLIAKALLISLVSFLISGGFISVLYYPPFWYLFGFVLTMHLIVESELKSDAQAEGSGQKKEKPPARKSSVYENY